MLKRHRCAFAAVAFVFDAVSVSAAWIGTYFLRFRLGLFSFMEPSPPRASRFAELLPIIILADTLALAVLKLYRVPRPRALVAEFVQVLHAAALGWLATLAGLYYYSRVPYSRKMLFIFFFANCLALLFSRFLVRRIWRLLHSKGIGVQRAAIVGAGKLAQQTLHRLRSNPWLGLKVEYIIHHDDACEKGIEFDVPVVGALPELSQCLQEHPVEAVFVALPARRAMMVDKVVEQLLRMPVSVVVIPDVGRSMTLNSSVGDFGGLPFVQLRETPISGWAAVAKRLMDIVGALILLAIFGLPMLILAALVKLTSRGPVFFRQERMGLGGKPFIMLKFRSMRVDAEAATGPVWATRGDPRRTRLGALMRRFSLDELPQLINVLRGDMSLVGPRPERPYFIRQFSEKVPGYMLRHNVKAGITGWAQVRGLRGNTSLKKRLQYDLYYINNWSLTFDLLILLMTPFSGLIGRNAY